MYHYHLPNKGFGTRQRKLDLLNSPPAVLPRAFTWYNHTIPYGVKDLMAVGRIQNNLGWLNLMKPTNLKMTATVVEKKIYQMPVGVLIA